MRKKNKNAGGPAIPLEEKIGLLYGDGNWKTHGSPTLNLSGVVMRDGPLGLRDIDDSGMLDGAKTNKATCYPAPCLTACSFDVDLLSRIGESIGKECRHRGIDVLLAPGVNIKRNPLCGRNFEYYSEDPLLAGKLGAAFINGIQKQGVGACLKHFACNSQETGRMVNDSIIDDRALHEIYLRAFSIAVKEADPWMVMSSYNKVNGEYACSSEFLLKQTLRADWGYEGVVVSDWGASAHYVDDHNRGLDVEMPCTVSRAKDLTKAYKHGKLSRQSLDECATHVVSLLEKADKGRKRKDAFDEQEADALALEAATKSMVLLQNDGILPLKKSNKAVYVGELAKSIRIVGGGSSCVNARKTPSFIAGLAESDKYAQGYRLDGKEDETLRIEAADIASKADVVVLFMGLSEADESEGFDRESLSLPEVQLHLFESIYAVNQNIVVVLNVGSPVELPFADRCKAILLAYLPGQDGAEAIRAVLSGEVSPSGKLAETWPIHLSDVPSFGFYPGTLTQSEYRESIYVGYRYYCSSDVPVRFPFGHGLSYAKFKYGKLTLSDKAIDRDGKIKATIDVTNNSAKPSELVVELYASPCEGNVFKAKRSLIDFKKQLIGAKETKTYEFEIPYDAFSHYDIGSGAFEVEGGKYAIEVGESATSIVSKAIIKVKSDVEFELRRSELPNYYNLPEHGFMQSDVDFEHLLGHPVQLPRDSRARPYTTSSTFGDIGSTFIGKIINKKAHGPNTYSVSESESEMIKRSIDSTPIRCMHMHGYKSKTILAIVDMANGHYFKALLHFIFGVGVRDL
ncbi:MAG TPA: glycoside hydrolase family 3 C-terminal domain-containing protein [Candidatus Enteromonas pullicola]|uniref:Glycoside hydrolase family 3 C-terminal domain-containing protein n=1 Tax=Candidatus Alloenteromonas pullicola TaxID=2840784 RepID=A0A9D1LN41_9FIRM|nr:glycoside hydrolase family 3 C-terminal domain-containing protein [Candidatus Enteromonas pullicola]